MNHNAITNAVRIALLSTAGACLSFASLAVYASTLGTMHSSPESLSRITSGTKAQTKSAKQQSLTQAQLPKDANATQNVNSSKQTEAQKRAQKLATIHVTGVVGQLLRQTTTKRNNAGIVDSISAVEAGKFPAHTVAAALERVPGVTVSRGANGQVSTISVRGFGPSFVHVLINGHPLASPNFSREADLNVLPVTVLQKAVVYKTSQAFLPAGGIGSTVNIVTWKPLEFNGFHANARVGAEKFALKSGPTNKVEPRVSAMIGDTTKNASFGWLLSVEYERRNMTYAGLDEDWLRSPLPSVVPATNQEYFYPIQLFQTIDHQENTRKSAYASLEWRPTQGLDISGNFLLTENPGRTIEADNVQYFPASTIASMTADKNNTLRSYTTTTTGGDQDVFKPAMDVQKIREVDADIKAAYTLGDGNTITYEATSSSATNDAPNQWLGNAGTIINNGETVMFHNPQGNSPGVGYYTGGPGFTNLDDIYTHLNKPQGSDASTRNFGNKLTFRHDFESGVVSSVQGGVAIRTESSRTVGYHVPDQGRMIENFFGPFNVLLPAQAIDAHLVNVGNLFGKYGANLPKAIPTFNTAEAVAYLQTSAGYDQLPPAQRAAWIATLAKNGGIHSVPETTSFARIHELDRAAYIMANLDGSMDLHNWSLQLGVRYSQTNDKSYALGQPLVGLKHQVGEVNSAVQILGPVQSIVEPGHYSYFLPSMNFKFHILSNLLLRAAYSRTLNRPELNNLSAAKSYGTQTQFTLHTGNAGLKPELSRNADLGVGWYLGPSSYFALDYFKKWIKNDVTSITVNVPVKSIVSNLAPDLHQSFLATGFFVTSPQNLGKSTARGYEASFAYKFSFLPGWLNGFGLSGAYTHVHSQVASIPSALLNGVSFSVPGLGNSYNVSAFYDNNKLSARLSYDHRAKFLTTLTDDQGLPEITAGAGTLDFSAQYAISKRWSLFGDATNLTNTNLFEYTIIKDRPKIVSLYGRRYDLGVAWKF